jgi:nucleoside-diphosphate-sugar epimerase
MKSENVAYAPEKILITGVNGFIGSHLAERLIKKNIETLGLCRRVEELDWLEGKGLKIIKGNILNIGDIVDKIGECDIIIHCAGWSGGGEISDEMAWKTNVEGTANLLDLAKKSGAKKFVYISSIAVYGMNNNLIIDEKNETPNINELYTDSKIAAEKLVISSGIPYVIIRPGCIYGPRGEGWTVSVVNQIKNGFKLLGNDAGLINLGFIENFIDGLCLVIEKKEALNKIFNINDGKPITYNEFYSAFAKMLGLQKLPFVPEWRVQLSHSILFSFLRLILRKPTMKMYVTHFRFTRSEFSIDKAKRILNYTPKISFEQGMIMTEKWLKTNHYLD